MVMRIPYRTASLREVPGKVSQSPHGSLIFIHRKQNFNKETLTNTLSQQVNPELRQILIDTQSVCRRTDTWTLYAFILSLFISVPICVCSALAHSAASLKHNTISCSECRHGPEMKMTLIGCCKRCKLKGNVWLFLPYCEWRCVCVCKVVLMTWL